MDAIDALFLGLLTIGAAVVLGGITAVVVYVVFGLSGGEQ